MAGITQNRQKSLIFNYVFCIYFEAEPTAEQKLTKFKNRMYVISFSWFKESGVICIFFRFLVVCSDSTKNNEEKFRGEVVPRRARNSKIFVQNFFTETNFMVLNIKKLHMFIKRKNRQKTCTYWMLLSFRTSVTYNFCNFTWDNCVHWETNFIGQNFFARHCQISGASIQAWDAICKNSNMVTSKLHVVSALKKAVFKMSQHPSLFLTMFFFF